MKFGALVRVIWHWTAKVSDSSGVWRYRCQAVKMRDFEAKSCVFEIILSVLLAFTEFLVGSRFQKSLLKRTENGMA